MAEFTKLIITDKGKELLAGVTTSANKIEFTRVSTSDRAYREDEIANLTDLDSIKQTNNISSIAVQASGKIKIEAAFENRELSEGYFIRAIGIYAKSGSSAEVLYAVAIEKTGRYSIPAYQNATVNAVYLKLFLLVENFENVKLEVSPGAFITIGEIDKIRDELRAENNAVKEEMNRQLEEFGNKADGFDKNDVDISPDGNTITVVSGDKKIVTEVVSDTQLVKKLYVKNVLIKTKTTTFSDNYTKVREVIE